MQGWSNTYFRVYLLITAGVDLVTSFQCQTTWKLGLENKIGLCTAVLHKGVVESVDTNRIVKKKVLDLHCRESNLNFEPTKKENGHEKNNTGCF